MAWVAIDKDGTEWIYADEPNCNTEYWHANGGHCVELPKGSIMKLIGRELGWKDEAVELKEEKE